MRPDGRRHHGAHALARLAHDAELPPEVRDLAAAATGGEPRR
ncbi:hypothetical protein ACIQ7D_11295 [Streptomyces sp. NPDC096310]